MRINEKTLFSFANSKPVDKEGYLSKRGEGERILVESVSSSCFESIYSDV